MSRHGKKYFNALKKAPQKAVSLAEAVKFVKDNAGAKFDETVDVYFHLCPFLTPMVPYLLPLLLQSLLMNLLVLLINPMDFLFS